MPGRWDRRAHAHADANSDAGTHASTDAHSDADGESQADHVADGDGHRDAYADSDTVGQARQIAGWSYDLGRAKVRQRSLPST